MSVLCALGILAVGMLLGAAGFYAWFIYRCYKAMGRT